MKTLPVCLLTGLLLAAPTLALSADPLQSLNLRPEAAREAIAWTFELGAVTLPSGYGAFWVLDDAHRAALVPPLLAVVRAYVESGEFAARLGPSRPVEPLVASRLKQFLELSADVDFQARLVTKNGVSRFADPRLESRSPEWKLCFRAGPQTLAAARAYAGDWLNTLGVSAER